MTKQRTSLYVGVLFIVALAIRASVAFNSGIWADEGSFLAVVAAPSWRGMIDFLRLHESHPPFFYALMRLWMSATGGSDIASLLLPVIIGASVVPAVYHAGASLFSRRTGLLAATLSAISPALTEYSAQLRPYGLLPLLVLASSWSMIVAIRRRDLRSWAVYVAATVLLLYTHNWGWVVVSAQQLAVILALTSLPRDARRSAFVQWITAWCVILVAYSPWFPVLAYQVIHAGHSPVTFDSGAAKLGFVLFGFLTALQTFFLGTSGGGKAIVAGTVVALVVVAVTVYRQRNRSVSPGGSDPLQPVRSAKDTALTLGTVILASCVIAMILSPGSNLMLPRCLAVLVPLVLIVFSRWCVNFESARASAPTAPVLAAAIVGFILGQAAFELSVLARTPRSNAREIAFSMRRQIDKRDLLILVPEWYSASFNHYFGDPIDQIDYPHTGRVIMTDFADTWKRAYDIRALAALKMRIVQTRTEGRRIWLVSEREHLISPSAPELALALKNRQPGPLSRASIAAVRDAIQAAYGQPEMVVSGNRRVPRYDDIRAFLYSPGNSRALK